MSVPISKSIILTVLTAISACGTRPPFMPLASAADPINITDTSNTTWRNTDGAYTFNDGLDFTFDGSKESDNLEEGYSSSPKKIMNIASFMPKETSGSPIKMDQHPIG